MAQDENCSKFSSDINVITIRWNPSHDRPTCLGLRIENTWRRRRRRNEEEEIQEGRRRWRRKRRRRRGGGVRANKSSGLRSLGAGFKGLGVWDLPLPLRGIRNRVDNREHGQG